ncbi:hypothetical protein BdWA1_001695 [Babesia duncani]|uniref:Tudor domain-containing protein n=1 Tax=Babesia duncani TaxID=323732 RepID=A0AAD9UP16_9APIC|nr:hypothetical protein BdWA1_003623 [Babesia duncani]KAK2196449.1 hypothetical protein BdWA1_001695 [Babesia duncani]
MDSEESLEAIEESIEVLEAKIVEYRNQLDTINSALQDDPDNEQLLVLKRDLNEVITLTEDLLKYKQESEGIFLQDDEPEPEESTVAEPDACIPSTQIYNHLIGRICVVLYNEKQRYGEIVQVQGNEPGDLVVIEILGSRERCGLSLKDLQLLQGPQPSECPNGTVVQALYLEEGPTDTGFVVTYKDYNTSEQVPRDRIRLKVKKVIEYKEITTPAGYKIPENLIIKQNDSEKERLRKRKLVQTLKKQQRAEKVEAEAQKRANSWRNFQNKAGAKNKSGFMTGKREGSIFKSEPPPSGITPTPQFIPRRKHDYNNAI